MFAAGRLSGAAATTRIRKGSGWVTWTPEAKNEANLGGAIRTLDGFDGSGPLDDGILSRNGWYLLDDSRDVVRFRDRAHARGEIVKLALAHERLRLAHRL